jgi:hypothetical protein
MVSTDNARKLGCQRPTVRIFFGGGILLVLGNIPAASEVDEHVCESGFDTLTCLNCTGHSSRVHIVRNVFTGSGLVACSSSHISTVSTSPALAIPHDKSQGRRLAFQHGLLTP